MQKALTLGALALLAPAALAGGGNLTSEPPMLATSTPNTSGAFTAQPLFTVGETLGGYQPTGIFDGMGCFPLGPKRALVTVTSELNPGNGYAYSLRTGTQLTGARVHGFIIERVVAPDGTVTTDIKRAGLAYNVVYDRAGNLVTDPAQINETGNAIDGFGRFCSAQSVVAGSYNFEDNIFFVNEETTPPFHPHGGSVWALDVDNNALWAVPALGRGGWENVTPLSTGDAGTVALLMGDDTSGAPLYLYVGEKNAAGTGSFLDRNGLVVGKVYAWKANAGDLDPQTFNGLNSFRRGQFVEVQVKDVAMAGQPGYDAAGYLNSDVLQGSADLLGCFSFSRPEDLATNPLDPTQAVFASTGRGSSYPADNWGTVYVVDVDFGDLSADMIIVCDSDGLAVPDEGVRSPDNLDWAGDGKIYIQEDRSTSPSSLFGGTTGIEASIWQLDPITRSITRVAEIDRSVVVPAGTTDVGAGSIGNWESSGILDVTAYFQTLPGERLFIANVQAHGIRDGAIGDNPLLDEGGQLLFLSKTGF
jgi:hypothetical protein